MASTLTHLAVAQEYARKNPELVKNLQELYDGVVMPDLGLDKQFTHYLDEKDWSSDSMRFITEPAEMEKFVLHDPLDRDLSLGILLHLYTDELYYSDKLFQPQDLENTTRQQFRTKHGKTMDVMDIFIAEQYGTSYKLTSPEIEEELSNNLAQFRKNNPVQDDVNAEELFFTSQDMEDFIEQTSSVDLQAIVNQIKTKHKMTQSKNELSMDM